MINVVYLKNSKFLLCLLGLSVLVLSVVFLIRSHSDLSETNSNQQGTTTAAMISDANANKRTYVDKIADMENTDKLFDINMLQNRPKENTEMNIHKLSLPNKKAFYLKILGPEERHGDYCGSGGCTYFAYVVKSSKQVSQITGFDSYSLDCDTHEISLSKYDSLFGSPNINKTNRVVRMYYHFSAAQATEDIYYINDDGSPTLIASYDQICQDKIVTLFRNKSFPSNFSEPFNVPSGWE